MSWVRLDDSFFEHRKTLAVGGDAAWLHVCAIGYCNRNETDGFVPKQALNRLSDRRKPVALVQRLVDEKMWETCPGGWLIHDYLHYQPSRSKLEDDRNKARERMAKNRRSSPDVRPNMSGSSPYPVPTRPVIPTDIQELSLLRAVPDQERETLIQSIVAQKLASRANPPDDLRAWRTTVERDVRKMLKNGECTQIIPEKPPPVPWCTPVCELCDGNGWITGDNGDPPEPCPNRLTEKSS